MAVTTTYSFELVKNLSTTNGETQVDVVGLATSGFAAIETHSGGHIDGDLYPSGGNTSASFTSVTGTNGAVSQLANGNLVIASQDADSILFKVVDSTTGATVVASTDLGDTNSTNADVAGLTGGRFVIVDQDAFTSPDNDIDVTIRNADGTAVTSFTIDNTNADDQNASVAALDNGNFAVSWQRNVSGNSQLWYAVYDANGATVKAATLLDSAGTVNSHPSVTATNNGFAIAYADNGWDGDVDVTLAQFNFAGTFQRFDNVANDSVTDSNPSVTRMSNGMLAVSYAAAFGDNDVIINLVDPATGQVVATRTGTSGQSIFDEQGSPSIAGAKSGKLAAFWINSTDSDVQGEFLQGVRTAVGDGADDIIVGDDFVDKFTGNGGVDTLVGAGGNDTLSGGDGNDILNGGQGVDNMTGGNQSDTFVLNPGDAPAGEIINGGTGADRILLSGNVVMRDATITSIEEVEFQGAGTSFAQFKAAQLGGGSLAAFLVVDGRNGQADQMVINMDDKTSVNLSGWTFEDWNSGAVDNDRIRINGDADSETFVGSSQRDDISGGNGTNTYRGGLGSDFLTGGDVGLSTDRFVFDTALGASNIDRINNFELGKDEIVLENSIFTGLATAANLAGSAFTVGASATNQDQRIIYNASNGSLFFDVDGVGGVAQQRFATLDAGLALKATDFRVT